MEEYRHKIFRSYLDTDPQKYVLPAMVKDVDEVSGLKPEVKSVNIHMYPDEHVVVLDGNNLWFCHEVHLGAERNLIKIKHSAELITGCCIQFKYKATDKSSHLVTDNKMKVSLYSHFSNRITKRIQVEEVS